MITPDAVSDRVSATAAEFRVNESGAATYSVALYGVPGTAGVAPKLSLNYSSQGPYGALGKGWSIGGQSTITRCRATREAGDFIGHAQPDGSPAPINFSDSDRLCMDGQRLVPSTATCPSAAGLGVVALGTEIETFQRICAYYGSNGTVFLTVERKDGSKSWYGDRDNDGVSNRPDGYFETTSPINPAAALAWAQTRYQDSTGNYIDFFYQENPAGAGTGEHLLSEVHYTGKIALSGQSAPSSAPYARIIFNYGQRPLETWSRAYASGGTLTQSRRLESITSCATMACAQADQARHYVLTYQLSPSGSGLDTLSQLQECRDSSLSVCSGATTFEWSQAQFNFTTAEQPANLPISTSALVNFKTGDVNGDGRQDFVYLREGGGCTHDRISVGTGVVDGAGNATFGFAPSSDHCLSAQLRDRGDGAWHLFDYTGDGRDDLLVAGPAGQGWRLHPSIGSRFDLTQNLISGQFIPSQTNKLDQLQLADFNGDGLKDVLYPANGGLRFRLMERGDNAYALGAERTAAVVEEGLVPLPEGCDGPGSNVRNCERNISGVPTHQTGYTQLADFNGDAASDVILRVTTSAEYFRGWGTPDCDYEQPAEPPVTESQPGGALSSYSNVGATSFMSGASGASSGPNSCWERIETEYHYALETNVQPSGSILFSAYGVITNGTPKALVLGDANGDSLTDVFVQTAQGTSWYTRLNTGLQFVTGHSLPINGYGDQARMADANGDGRTDFLHIIDRGTYKAYNVQYALPGGGYAASVPLPGGNAKVCIGTGCNERLKAPLFSDFDGDGVLDFMSIKLGDNADMYVSRSTQRFAPRDVIVGITNGLGSNTAIKYASLTNGQIYKRGNSALNGVPFGRGSPVLDLLSPMYVVASASSSSPQHGEPLARATVHYRYANARVQAGGRGYLGFERIETVDPNQGNGLVVTSTDYAQNFPFIGMPIQTVKRAVANGTYTPSCQSNSPGNECFGFPGETHGTLGGQTFSSNVQNWESAHALNAQQPLHVRTHSTHEWLRDPFNSEWTGGVHTEFTYGSYGNVDRVVVSTTTGTEAQATSRVTTANIYVNDPVRWRLGRLSGSTTTHWRPDEPNVVRSTSFGYALGGAATGLLTEERVMPGGGADKDLAKHHELDSFGNRITTTTCAAPATNCEPAGLEFQPLSQTTIKRYSRTEFDAIGRFATANYEPFWNGNGAVEHRTTRIISRNIFGDPIEATDVNNRLTYQLKGNLGRDFYVWKQESPGYTQGALDGTGGQSTLTTYRFCTQVACADGASFRQQVATLGSPRTWTYFDVLGRPILKASETFNAGVAGKDISAICTSYNAAGKPSRVSNPFFLSGSADPSTGPNGLSGVCVAPERRWTNTTYDLLGRKTKVVAPDASEIVTDYYGADTTIWDQRLNPTTQTKNAQGELERTSDAAGLVTRYAYYADGTLKSVTRDTPSGDVVNSFTYDSLGRKVQQSDPDTGTTNVAYNALGELIAQVDGQGQRIEHWMDARGRVWKKVVKRSNGEVDTESNFTYDTGVNALGQLSGESISGRYQAWEPQGTLSHSFSRQINYDALGRPSSTLTEIDGSTFTTQQYHDSLGRVWRYRDVSGLWRKTEYSARGFAAATCSSVDPEYYYDSCANNPETYQRTLEMDEWGHILHERRGNTSAMDVRREYWPDTGRLKAICSGTAACNLVNELYAWDSAGNLSSHVKEGRYLERFEYDALNRLEDGRLLTRNGQSVDEPTLDNSYDPLGNICAKNGVNYVYGSSSGCTQTSGGQPHAVQSTSSAAGVVNYYYDGRGNQTVRDAPGTANDRTIRYSPDDKAHEIQMGSGELVRFWYGGSGARYKQQRGGTTKLYFGDVELILSGGVATFKRYISGIALQTVANGAVASTKFLFHDQLGSVARVANADGTIAEALDYVAFGGRRSTSDPHAQGVAAINTARGFTGHEMLDGTGVIHMNGRIYDADLGRFLQADPVIQAPENAQGWNAYSYVFNNPLVYTDPTGMITLRQVLGIAIAIVGTVVCQGMDGGFWAKLGMAIAFGAASGYVSTGTWQGALYGAFSAALFFGIGEFFNNVAALNQWGGVDTVGATGLTAGNIAAKVLAHGMAGGVMSSLQGGKFGHGFASAGFTEALSPGVDTINPANPVAGAAARISAAAIVGGTASVLAGGKFGNGATTAAFARAFNGEIHHMLRGQRAHAAIEADIQERLPQYDVSVEQRYVSDLWTGRADVLIRDPLTDITHVFEIKPASHASGYKWTRSIRQLDRTIEGFRASPFTSGEYVRGDWDRFFGKNSYVATPLPLPGVDGNIYWGNYTYGNGQNGLILYNFAENVIETPK